MKDRVGRSLAAALIAGATLLVPACGLLPRSYDVDIRPTGNVAAQLKSLYVIVSKAENVQEALSSESSYERLLDENLQSKYETFVMYRPLEGGSWSLEHAGNQNRFVSHEVDGENIEVSIDSDLIETGKSEYELVVLAFYGSEGFQSAKVDHATLAANASQVVEVSGVGLTLRDR